MQIARSTHFGGILIPSILLILIQLQSCLSISIKDEMQLTDDQQGAFDRFKAKAIEILTDAPSSYMKNELVLIKYFRFCEMDENKALERLKDNLKWRLNLGFEKLSEDETNEYLRLYPFSTFQDKIGRGVLFVPGQYWNLFVASGSIELTKKFQSHVYHIIEETYVKGITNLTGRTASGILYFSDLGNVDPMKVYCGPCIKMMNEIITQVELRWPGGLQLIFNVNANPFLRSSLNLMKAALTPKVQEMVSVYDDNDAVWMPELLKLIAQEKIPQELYIKSKQQPQQGAAAGGNGMMMPPPPPGMGPPPGMPGPMGMFGPPQAAQPAPAPEGRGIGRKKKRGKKAKKVKKVAEEEDDDDDGVDE